MRKRTNKYIVDVNVLKIITANGAVIIADTSDYDLISKYSWCISKTGYAVANINNKVTKLHRYVLGINDPKKIIDHKNGNTLDNRKVNLRVCTNAENARNCKVSKNNTSGVSGVQFIKKSGRYRARITVNRKEIRLGHYKTFDEAVKARLEAEKKYFGEFAPCVGCLRMDGENND